MGSRLLRHIWSYTRMNCALRRIQLQSHSKSYATSATLSPLTTLPTLNNAVYQRRHYTATQPAPEEQLQTSKVDGALDNLFGNYKHLGYVQHERFLKLLELLDADPVQSKQLLTTENIQFLLSTCGTHMPAQSAVERMQLFERLWSHLKQQQLLTKDCYLQRLHVLQHNRMPLTDLSGFLDEIAKVDADCIKQPTLYSELLTLACSCGNMQQATEILATMRASNFALNEQNFNALIMGHARNHDLNSCQATLDSMQAAGVPLSSETQTTLFVAYMENDVSDKALEILKTYRGQFKAAQIMKMLLTALTTDLNVETVEALVNELPPEYTNGTDMALELRQLCNELLYKGKTSTMTNILAALPAPEFGENQNIDTYGNALLNELFRAKLTSNEILQFTQLLSESGKNTRALYVATEIALRRSPPIALPYFEELVKIEPLRPHYFWPLIMYNFRRHGESGILTTLRHMQQLNVEFDKETLTIYVLPHLSITLENPVQGMKMILDTGVKVSQLLTPTLRHLLGQHKIIECVQLIEAHASKVDVFGQLMPALTQLSVNARATKRYHQFAKLLTALSKRLENPKQDFVGKLLYDMISRHERLQNDLHAFQRFLTEIHKIGLHISLPAVGKITEILKKNTNDDSGKPNKNDDVIARITLTLQAMSDRAILWPLSGSNGGNEDSSGNTQTSFAKHPRDMSLDDLECHLIELESKGMNARGVLRRLLQLCVRDNRLERALEIKAKCDKLRVEESPGMLASIFDLYMKVNDLPNAEKTLAQLQKNYPGFQIDEHKFIDYAALLIHENHLEAALLLLEQRAAKQRINGGDYVMKNVWNVLTNVAHLAARQEPKLAKERNLTREVFEFLRKHGYCNPHNAVLGPIVREYLLRGDIQTAVADFRQLAEKYKHTPLQYEMLSLLLRLINKQPEECAKFSITSEEAQRLLSEVTEVITRVHGAVNMNSALVLAFAESGTDNQLRRLLINPEFSINHELLQKNCEHLGKEGSVRTLLRLARGARGLGRVVNEQIIYDMLLNNFVKINDYAAALDLYERLEADDELKISTEFLKNLVKLLKVNKIQVPSNIALRAQII